MDGLKAVAPRYRVQIFSLVMILVSCTGIFLPLEVALNQAWGVTKSRNYLHNQVIAFGLAILMVVLGMASILVNAAVREVLSLIFVHQTNIKFIDFVLHITYQGACSILLAATTGIASIAFFFSIYWLWLTAFVGVNLLQSAFTNWCPAMSILRAMGLKDATCISGK